MPKSANMYNSWGRTSAREYCPYNSGLRNRTIKIDPIAKIIVEVAFPAIKKKLPRADSSAALDSSSVKVSRLVFYFKLPDNSDGNKNKYKEH